jgi:hypothetical protein
MGAREDLFAAHNSKQAYNMVAAVSFQEPAAGSAAVGADSAVCAYGSNLLVFTTHAVAKTK